MRGIETPEDNLNRTLAEQRDYYRARAAEYDEWFLRQGRYDHGEEANARWRADVEQVRAALDAAPLTGQVLEFASGTGLWTERIARTADRVTALDAAPETIAIARERLASGGLAQKVEFEEADLFAWRPEPGRARAYDGAFMGFWLSHVPEERLDPFLSAVAASLRPGGRVFIVDNRRQPTSSSRDQPLAAPGDAFMTRRLNDGRTFRIIKVFREPAALAAAFARHGIDLRVEETSTYFQYGLGRAE
ncbi:MAG: class I SAM-dependent methyltransferase [Chloroflexota bacterium]|nr:class I SAM-dependent methyltransferase [Chloroflexota bacterium]